MRRGLESLGAFMLALAVGWMLMAGCGWCGDAIVRGAEIAVPIAENMDQAGNKVRIFSGPKYYRDDGGAFRAIDMTSATTTDLTWVKKSKGIRPVELRKDGDKTGFMVLKAGADRPEYLAIGLESVTFDGKPVAVNLTAPTDANKELVNIGGLKVQTRANGSRVLVPATDAISSYQAVFSFSAIGLTMESAGGSFLFFGKDGKIKFVINPPKICGTDGNPIPGIPQGQHTLVSVVHGPPHVYRYTKSQSGLDKLGLPKSYFLDVDVEYTSGSGTFTVPAGVTELLVTMWGGGGSGGVGKAGTEDGEGGGGAGTIYQKTMTVTPLQEIAYSVGAGGAAVLCDSNGKDGVDGADTTFGAYTASKGTGGNRYADGASPNGDGGDGGNATDGSDTGVGGAGGSSGTGEAGADGTNVGACWGGGGGGRPWSPWTDDHYRGGTGYDGTRAASGYAAGGGGSSYGAGGAGSPNVTTNGLPGTDGGGGGGGYINLGYYSGAGGDGGIIITYTESPAGGGATPMMQFF